MLGREISNPGIMGGSRMTELESIVGILVAKDLLESVVCEVNTEGDEPIIGSENAKLTEARES